MKVKLRSVSDQTKAARECPDCIEDGYGVLLCPHHEDEKYLTLERQLAEAQAENEKLRGLLVELRRYVTTGGSQPVQPLLLQIDAALAQEKP